MQRRLRVSFTPDLLEQRRDELQQGAECHSASGIEFSGGTVSAPPHISKHLLNQKALSQPASASNGDNFTLSSSAEFGSQLPGEDARDVAYALSRGLALT